MKETLLEKINEDNKVSVLLIGNGIIRAFENDSNWDSLLNNLDTDKKYDKEILNKLPYPMKPVYITNDQVDIALKRYNFTDNNTNEDKKKLIKAIFDIGADTILTTNYTYDLEYGMCDEFSCKPMARCKYRKVAYDIKNKRRKRMLHTYFQLPNSNTNIWHIHGEAAITDSIIIGQYYYGNLLSYIQQYMSEFRKRYSQIKNTKFLPKSWIDYFMIGEIYTIGFGMDFSELDIWWIANCKKRFNNLETNLHIYEPNISSEKKEMALSYGYEVITKEVKGNEYINYYYSVIDDIKKRIGKDK